MFKYGNLHEPHIKHNKEPNIKSLFLFIVLWICSQHFQSTFVWPDTTKIFVSVTFGTIVFNSHAL